MAVLIADAPGRSGTRTLSWRSHPHPRCGPPRLLLVGLGHVCSHVGQPWLKSPSQAQVVLPHIWGAPSLAPPSNAPGWVTGNRAGGGRPGSLSHRKGEFPRCPPALAPRKFPSPLHEQSLAGSLEPTPAGNSWDILGACSALGLKARWRSVWAHLKFCFPSAPPAQSTPGHRVPEVLATPPMAPFSAEPRASSSSSFGTSFPPGHV